MTNGSDENTLQSPPRMSGSNNPVGSAPAAHVWNFLPDFKNTMVNPFCVF
ncbi:MAG: hypothetical protein ACLPSL_09210 [Smithella sp.]